MEITETATTNHQITFRTTEPRVTASDLLAVAKELRERKVPKTASVFWGNTQSLSVRW